jgi:hypothetical protein
MKTMTDPAVRGHAGRRTAGPAVAGLFFVAAWVAGLVIGPVVLDVTAPDAAVLRVYAESQGAAIAQVVLTQGVAAVALAVVVLALGQAARGRDARRIARRIEVAGLAAVVLSLVQGAHGIRLAGWVAPGGDSAQVGRVFEFISRIDGVNMLLLAIVTVSGIALARQAGVLPPRADLPRVVLAAALTGGGAGYLLLGPALAWMAWLALPLLLIWVACMGVWLSLSPAAIQTTDSSRQTQKPDNRSLLGLAPAKGPHTAGHQPGPGRGDCADRDVASVPSQMATGVPG